MKQLAYATILLRKDGYPCIFYGDLYGIPHSNVEPVPMIKTLIALRKLKAYGRQHDYFDHRNIIGWTREGDNRHLDSGLAVIGSGEKFIDCLDNCSDVVTIDSDGCGVFKVKGRSCSVWVRK